MGIIRQRFRLWCSSSLWFSIYRKELVFSLLSFLYPCRHLETRTKFSFGTLITGTLLNRLFATEFDVMNENERRQTTKGELFSPLISTVHLHSLSLQSMIDLMIRYLDVKRKWYERFSYGCRRYWWSRKRRRSSQYLHLVSLLSMTLSPTDVRHVILGFRKEISIILNRRFRSFNSEHLGTSSWIISRS